MSDDNMIIGNILTPITLGELKAARGDKGLTKSQSEELGKRVAENAGMVTLIGYLNQPRKKEVEVQDEEGNVVERKYETIMPSEITLKSGEKTMVMERVVMRTLDGFNVTKRSFRPREAAVLLENLCISRQDHKDNRERYQYFLQTSSDALLEGPTIQFTRSDGSTGQRRTPTVELPYVNRVGVVALDHHLPEQDTADSSSQS